MKVFSIILGILLIIGGFFCLFQPGATFLSLGLIVGILLLVNAIGTIIDFAAAKKGYRSGFDLAWGIIAGILGVLLIVNRSAQFMTDVVFIYIFATWLLIGGIIRIAVGFKMKGLGSTKWGWGLAMGIIFIILSILSFLNPVVTAFTIGFLLAVIVITAGINLITLGAAVLDD